MLNIKNPEADRLARELAKRLNESITEVIIEALREKLLREKGKKELPQMKEMLLQIGERCSLLPDIDTRSTEEILGYDDYGLPK